ncbi:hypothetical protein [Clostridium tarantellae]|uniref:Uncharacterized protein n=1 Tax=Clostridium tarantellae TaxID=39493 RepID=A0A6I1MMA5_9CLOT|nr:hypothetical protein [Clostridium tarantellae]MPQ44144.1 hypothetical protein [Clostridium tarantellae]
MSRYSNMVDHNPYNHNMNKSFSKPQPYYNVPPNFYPNNYNNPGNFNNSFRTSTQNFNYGFPSNYYNYANSYKNKIPCPNHNALPSTYNNINNQHIKYAPCTSQSNYFNNNYDSNCCTTENTNCDLNDKYFSQNNNNIPQNSNYHFCSKTYNTLKNQPYGNFLNSENNTYNSNKSNYDFSQKTYNNEAAFTQNTNSSTNDFCNHDFCNHHDYINHICNDSYKDISPNKGAQFLSTSSCNPVVPPGCILLYNHKNITSNGSDINYNINNGSFILAPKHCYLINIYISGFTAPFQKLFFIMFLNGCATGATPIQSEAINSYNSATAYTIITTTTNTTLQILNATNGVVNNVTSSISLFQIC